MLRPRMGVLVIEINAEAITPEAYAPFGEVITARASCSTRTANLGTATRFLEVGALRSTRADARPHLSVYRCTAWSRPWSFELLERHEHSTQVFLPQGASRYLVLVAPGGASPDLSRARAFLVEGTVGISYHPGTWHHPMIALTDTDFTCLVWEDGSHGDCEEHPLAVAIRVSEPAPGVGHGGGGGR